MESSEFNDFKNEILRNGLDIADFQLNENDLTKPLIVFRLQGLVTVKRKSTKKQKSYNSGHGTHWIADFSDDLKSGYFN